MAKTTVVARDPYRWNASSWSTKEQWRKWERVGMLPEMSIDDIVLDWPRRESIDLKIKEAIEEVTFDRTIEGASTVNLTVRDPDLEIFSQRLGHLRKNPPKRIPVDEGWQPIYRPDDEERIIDLILDDVYFRLVKINFSSAGSQAILTFEDRMIWYLRRKWGLLKASRAQVTRAEFILRLLREIKQEKIPFICPELHLKQPMKKLKDVADDPDMSTGFPSRARFRIQKGLATNEQRKNMGIVFDEAGAVKNVKAKALKALVLAVIQESWAKNLPLGQGDKDSIGILQIRQRTARAMGINPSSIRESVRAFLTRGFWGKGGAIDIARANPHSSAGWVAQQVQGSEKPDAYDKWSSEADHWIDGWKSEPGIAGGGGSYIKSYQYTRDLLENSWECMNRLADEVNWRIFPVGKAMYYMSERDLYNRRIRHVISPDSPEFIDFDSDTDQGKPASTMNMTVVLDRWGAPPGCTVQLTEEFGPFAGRWLVSSSTRDWFRPTADLVLKQPRSEHKEPAHERIDRADTAYAGGGAGLTTGKSGKLYAEMKRISDNTTGYLWGGGHGKPMAQIRSTAAFDCSGAVSLALFRAGMWQTNLGPYALGSGEFGRWGSPGRGEKLTVWYNGAHIFIQFEDGAGIGQKRFDTGGPGGGDGPKLRSKNRSTTGFIPRHWPGT